MLCEPHPVSLLTRPVCARFVYICEAAQKDTDFVTWTVKNINLIELKVKQISQLFIKWKERACLILYIYLKLQLSTEQ